MQARIRCIVVAFVVLSFTLLGGCGGGGTGPVAGQPTVLGEPVAVPAGVDPAVMQELAQALEQQLIAQGGKGISDVTGEPVYPLMRDENVLDATLAWEYNNTGDYDQNSETNIADLTPLGLHLGKTPTSSGWAAARTADGDRNDEVNISDVTPIGANFGSVVINYVVECDQHDNDTWVPVGNVAQSAGVQQGGTGVLQYSTTVTNGAPAARFRVVAGPEIAAGDLIALDGTGPGPADFTVFVAPTPDSGALPLDIMFSVTFIKAVGPIDVEIDYGDGSATDTDTSPGGSALQFNHTYTIADTFTVSVSATDNGSGETSATQVAVMPGVTPPASPIIEESNWTIYNITDDENWGKHSAVALLGDVPVIAYTRDDFNDVYFARAT